MSRMLFEEEFKAREFAKQVDGTVRMRQLPGYMNVEILWLVEWD